MKRTIATFVAGLTLGLMIMGFASKVQFNSGAMAMAAPVPAALAVPMPENHCPNIHHAIEALNAAMNDMSKANHDFCGNKQDAMEQAGRALQSLRRAEDCDRCK